MAENQQLTPNYYIKMYNDHTYKLILFKYPGSKKDKDLATSRDINDNKLDHHISRARSMIYEYSACNEWDHFVTLTLDQKKYDRYDLQKYIKDLGQWIRDQRKKGMDLKYMLIPEPHKDGAWHMHGLVKGFRSEDLREFELHEKLPNRVRDLIRSGHVIYDIPEYRNKFGYVTAEKVRDPDAVAKYVTKYIVKALECARTREKEKKLYYTSRGLNIAQKIIEGTIPPDKLAIVPFDYENDYIKIKDMDHKELMDFIQKFSDIEIIT